MYNQQKQKKREKNVDVVWVTQVTRIEKVECLPFSEAIGDHSTLVIDIPSNLIHGNYPSKLASPEDRRLTGYHSYGVKKYSNILK